MSKENFDGYYEDYVVGHRWEHEPRRTVTETDNILFCAITMNAQPLHLDVLAAHEAGYDNVLVNGGFTLGLMIGLAVRDTTSKGQIVTVGLTDVVFGAPVFVGDTLRSVTTVRDKFSHGEDGQGHAIVTFYHEMLNQHERVVCSAVRACVVKRRGDEAAK